MCLYPDVLDSMARFSVPGVFNYSMLTLSDHERVLYIGAREALFALDPNDISKQLRPQVTHMHKRALKICFYSVRTRKDFKQNNYSLTDSYTS